MRYDWGAHVPGPHEIELRSGRFLDVQNPDPAAITLGDVAAGLANTCRFSGQCRSFYSVAQHAVLCSRYLEREGHDVATQLAALHHDDHEAFLGDVVRPLKGLLQPQYNRLVARMDTAIAISFGNLWRADAFAMAQVKEADNWALMVEARRLLPSRGKHWAGQACNWGVDVDTDDDARDLWADTLSPAFALDLYVWQHTRLVGALVTGEAAA